MQVKVGSSIDALVEDLDDRTINVQPSAIDNLGG